MIQCLICGCQLSVLYVVNHRVMFTVEVEFCMSRLFDPKSFPEGSQVTCSFAQPIYNSNFIFHKDVWRVASNKNFLNRITCTENAQHASLTSSTCARSLRTHDTRTCTEKWPANILNRD